MIVNLYFKRIAIRESEAHTPPVIYANTMLPSSILLKRFQAGHPIAGGAWPRA
jgi:hypothetical protein